MSNSVSKSDFVTTKANALVKTINVVGFCAVCGEAVSTTQSDKAFRHGYNRYRRQMNQAPNSFKKFSQEDDKACVGSGTEVVWKRVK